MSIKDFLVSNKVEIGVSVLASAIFALIIFCLRRARKIPKSIRELMNGGDFNDKDWKENVVKFLRIKETMKYNFPEYKGYLLVMYGSAAIPDNKLPNDYDFIVLMLGYPKNENRAMHNKGTSYVADSHNKGEDFDIVYRDYLSFLFAASSGMPYENSVLAHGKVIAGKEGYFQWAKNITKNILMDRDFLIRRFEDKITEEKREFKKCLNENKKFEHDFYYVIRAGYYYITSLLQLNRINKMLLTS